MMIHTPRQIHEELLLAPHRVEWERNNYNPYDWDSCLDIQDLTVYYLQQTHNSLPLQI